MVHVRALHHFAIDKNQELGIFPVIPLLDLGANLHPDRLPGHLCGNGHVAPEPIMLPPDALKISLVSFKLSFKVVAAVIDGVPVHVLTVKGLPGAVAALRLFRAEKQAALVLPIGHSRLSRTRSAFSWSQMT